MPALTQSMRPLVTAVIVFVATLAVAGYVVYKSELARQKIAHHQAQLTALEYAQAQQQNLQHALSATTVLAALVKQGQGNITDFGEVAAKLQVEFPGVSAFALAPDGVISDEFPLEENRAAIGLNLFQDPVMQQETVLARDSGQLVLAGPFMLKQGGLGLVARRAVSLEAPNGKPVFWGLVNVVVRLPNPLGATQLDQLKKRGYNFVLWRMPPASQVRQIIAQSAVLPQDALDFPVAVPNGIWTLSLAPVSGWGDLQGLSLKAALALLLSFLMAYAARQANLTQTRATLLEAEVALRSGEILALNRHLQATLNALPDLFFEMDESGRFLACHSPSPELLITNSNELY